jgi:nucleoside-diphosphate-sugar epimerase
MPNVAWHRCDLLDSNQIENVVAHVKPTHLLHLAWYTVPHDYWTSIENLRWVHASLHLIQAFTRQSGRRIVAAGSCAEYDWTDGRCSEATTPLRPATLYGACKLGVQTVLDAYCRQLGMSCAWGRVFFLYGPRENAERFVPSIIRSLLKGSPARCSHGNQIRDFLYVQDVASAFVALLACETSGAINIGSSQPIALKDIARMIAEKLGGTELLELGALPAKADDPPLLIADATRLKSETNWTLDYDWETGLDETIAWWRANLATRAAA